MNVGKTLFAQIMEFVPWTSFSRIVDRYSILFFTAFDPQQLLMYTDFGDISRLGAYTIGFFLFWLLTTLTSALTCYFPRPCEKNNSVARR
jgi:hypothetical protein